MSLTRTRTGGCEDAGLSDVPSQPRKASAGRLPTGRRKPELTENEIQKCIFQHLRTRGAPGIFAFHPKNGNSDMAGRKAGIHKALGVEPGVPDVIVLRRAGNDFDLRPEVYALELKTPKGRVSAAQVSALTRLEFVGVTAGVAYGLDEALDWLESRNLLIGRRT